MSLRRKPAPPLSETIEFKQGVMATEAKTPIDHIMEKLDRLAETKMQPDTEQHRLMARIEEIDQRTKRLAAAQQPTPVLAAQPRPVVDKRLDSIKQEVFRKIESLEARARAMPPTPIAAPYAVAPIATQKDPMESIKKNVFDKIEALERRRDEKLAQRLESQKPAVRTPVTTTAAPYTADAWVRERVRLDRLRAMQ